ncbi:hypothetical protein [Streptomyces sp. NPDC001635]
MSLRVGTGATAAGSALLVVSLALIVHQALHDDGARTVVGAAFIATALLCIALGLIHRWVTNTSAERRTLTEAQERARKQESKYFALEAAHEAEMTRLHRDVIAERASNTAKLAAERSALYAQLEKDRLQIETKAFQTGVMFERAGYLEPDAPVANNLIPFPSQAPAEAAPTVQRERSREHGGARP